ncbi:uncharacterized protein LY89DRAFT_665514 [Mollisia scopiformis]|uniref:Uncharacterized protein n=1 Tax=Mollisia scopiformis TaxID=149040 RepID=A0A194XLD2_MOLSC|nr:uncharacterized protein LY89DRAFT_665514 [Mollisia scopiformis]KUJ21050.1 hypothetical protein LY89DRAFT_665514 [Mollisia scopiformis]
MSSFTPRTRIETAAGQQSQHTSTIVPKTATINLQGGLAASKWAEDESNWNTVSRAPVTPPKPAAKSNTWRARSNWRGPEVSASGSAKGSSSSKPASASAAATKKKKARAPKPETTPVLEESLPVPVFVPAKVPATSAWDHTGASPHRHHFKVLVKTQVNAQVSAQVKTPVPVAVPAKAELVSSPASLAALLKPSPRFNWADEVEDEEETETVATVTAPLQLTLPRVEKLEEEVKTTPAPVTAPLQLTLPRVEELEEEVKTLAPVTTQQPRPTPPTQEELVNKIEVLIKQLSGQEARRKAHRRALLTNLPPLHPGN